MYVDISNALMIIIMNTKAVHVATKFVELVLAFSRQERIPSSNQTKMRKRNLWASLIGRIYNLS
jgi:hypothetical protein